jgi:glycosyltransferase involved in cell wall biosynthesis
LCPTAIIRPNHHQIGDVFQALDCLLVASHEEGFSLVTIEAMYGECPVVTTPVGIIIDMEEEHGQLAVPIPLNPTPQQVADGIRAAVSPERLAFIPKAQRVVTDQYTDEQMGRRWEKFLYEVTQWQGFPSAATTGTAHICRS